MLVDLRRTHRLTVQQLAQEDLGFLGGHLVDLRGGALIHVSVLRQRVPSDNTKVETDKSIRLSCHDPVPTKKQQQKQSGGLGPVPTKNKQKQSGGHIQFSLGVKKGTS